MRNWKPYFIENSKIPIWLSKVAPIEINAIALGPIILSRGEMSEQTKRHETIHFQQYLELLFVGFLILYFLYWILYICKGMSGQDAYYNIPFEREAYDNDADPNYLQSRKRYGWVWI